MESGFFSLRNGRHLITAAACFLIGLGCVNAVRAYATDETRILLCYNSEIARSDVMAVMDGYYGSYIKDIPLGRLLVYSVPSDLMGYVRDDRKLAELVEYIEVDRLWYADYTPNDPYWPQWNMQQIDVDLTWDAVMGDPSVIVALLDTGIDYNHVDLQANVDETLGWDYVNNDSDPWDDNGHGTAVGGVICAEIDNNIGVAGMAQITLMPMKVLNASGTGLTSNIVDAIYDAGNGGANVINMSLGSYGSSSSFANACNWADNTMGISVVAAAGNDGVSTKHYPAAYSSVIGVGAMNSSGGRWWYSNSGDNVEIMAPGVTVFTTGVGDTYGNVTGTSIASPHVAGAAALAYSYNATFSNGRVKNILYHWADDLGAPGYDNLTGWGELDCWNANGLIFDDEDMR